MIGKKILIVSVDGDLSTDNVMDWLSFFGIESLRYNVDVDFNDKSFSSSLKFTGKKNHTILKLDDTNYDFEDINYIWYRKYLHPTIKQTYSQIDEKLNNTEDFMEHLIKEYSSGLFSMFDAWSIKTKTLGSNITRQPSKMQMLILAKNLKIDIPNSLITTSKTDLRIFLSENREVITKNIRDGDLFRRKNKDGTWSAACPYTEVLTLDLIDKIPESFFISLFQEKLNKEFEIRTFYLDGNFYSSAIFSQLDEQTNVDFRMYNNRKPNRVIPFQLPVEIEKKITKLMKKLGLETGSLDFVKTIENRIVFLEVNPFGQYGMVSVPCNYNLDKKISKKIYKEYK